MEAATIIIQLFTGLTMAIYGVTQLTRPGGWLDYVPKLVSRLNPVPEKLTMQLHGGLNLVLGIWLMTGWQAPVIGWLSLLWWLSILPFAFYYDWRDGLRDITIIAGLVAYIILV